MSEGFTLVDLSALAKPAKTLIEKVSNAVGWFFDPAQVRRMARAEGDALIIRTQAEIHADELKKRALIRFINEEADRQTNIEKITMEAIPMLEDESKPDQLEADWVTNFFDKCRIIADDDMQILWSKVLAGEANNPGSYSKRTVNFLGSLSKGEAEIFSKLCSFLVNLGIPTLMIFDINAEIYKQNGLKYIDLKNLDSIGLIKYEQMTGFNLNGNFSRVRGKYHDQNFEIEFFEPGQNQINVGNVLLTQMGLELSALVKSPPATGFLNYIREQIQTDKIKFNIIHQIQNS